MIQLIQALAMAKANKARLARVLREIDAPRNAAIAEARLSARCFIDRLIVDCNHNVVKDNYGVNKEGQAS